MVHERIPRHEPYALDVPERSAAGCTARERPDLKTLGGAGHVNLYDRVDLIPWDKLRSFLLQHPTDDAAARRIATCSDQGRTSLLREVLD
jgi:hypothetical protein